jgi:hypothetical protein
MKRIFMILFLLSAIYLCLADDRMSLGDSHRKGISIPAENLKLQPQNRTTYNFMIPPMSILTSYWDYQIGAYTSIATRVQSPTAGNGVYLSYMGQRASNGQRRVFYAYLDHEGSVVVNNEITSSQIREGYVTHDIDRISGKPIFAWHSNTDPSDGELEINTAWDAFLEGIAGLISEPVTTMQNPIYMTINGNQYNDNEFDWPVVQIGPSPLPDHRRVYVIATNYVSHCNPGNPSENPYIAYADFTPLMLETGETLTWSYTTIPLLDNWNIDQTAWRRFFNTTVVGEDGNFYLIGYHVGELADTTPIDEPYLDVLVNTNYGEGEWTQYSINPDIQVPNPMNYFVDDNDLPYPYLVYSVVEGAHNSAYISPDGHLHHPLEFGFTIPDGTSYYPIMQYIKDVDFNTADHNFQIHDLYPTGVHPNDGNPVLPWDIDEDGIIDTTDTGTLAITPTWPFVHWDEAEDGGSMIFDYNYVKFTRANDQGMAACVWSSSLNAKLYNENPSLYPELAAYTGVPEIMISVYPVQGTEGSQWSDPISLNSVDTPEMNPGGDPIIPEWVNPGDYIEYLGVTTGGYKVGKLHLMFFDDNTWGAQALAGQSDGGRVTYATMAIAWNPGVPFQGPIVGNSDDTNSLPPVLSQNYPNPFNPSTTIAYNIMKQGNVDLTIYNVKGQKVRNLVNEIKPIGHYNVTWDGTSDNGSKVGSGVYFYRLESNGLKTVLRKMLLLK